MSSVDAPNTTGFTNVQNRLSACNLLRNKYDLTVNKNNWNPKDSHGYSEKNLWNLLDCENIVFNLKIPELKNIKYNQGYYGKLWHNLLYS